MKYDELVDFLRYNNMENERMFVPNEIFNDFAEIDGKTSSKTFCYAFYYLIMYLYRFAKYDSRDYTVKDLKMILGYSPTNKTTDKLIKRNGVLDDMGYLSQTTNYPTSWSFDKEEKVLIFGYYEDFINEYTQEEMRHFREHMGLYLNRKNKVIKVPIKGLHRSIESLKNNERNGVFFYIDNTTKINVETFLFCMANEDLGTDGFWVYSFIKYMNIYYDGDWNVSQANMGKAIGMSHTQLNRILDSLESHNMIYNDHKTFVVGLPSDIRLKGCSYRVKSSDNFHFSCKKTKKRDVIGFSTWCSENSIDYDEYAKNGTVKKIDGYDKSPFDIPENEDDDLSWMKDE